VNNKQRHSSYKSCYKYQFKVDEDIVSANIQVIGMTFAKIFINNIYIGHVITRHTLNYVVSTNSIQIFDIKQHLIRGENKIYVENTDFIGGLGTINIYGEILLKSKKKIIIKTDKTWQGARDTNGPWNLVRSFGAPPKLTGGLSYPDFERKLHSNVSEYMAAFNTIVSRTPKFLYRIILIIFKLYNHFDLLG
jgi:hypothetical protein